MKETNPFHEHRETRHMISGERRGHRRVPRVRGRPGLRAKGDPGQNSDLAAIRGAGARGGNSPRGDIFLA